MNKFKINAALLLILLTVISCKDKKVETPKTINLEKVSIEISGEYVSEEYQKRNEGYDWMAVSINQISDTSYHISVRSRIDLKKPSCTFDTDAIKTNDTTYKASIEGKNVLFVFTNDTLRITTEKEEDNGLLNYYCSGGGSVAGSYKKLKEPLDEKQIDPRVFIKTLSLQNISFDISTTGKGSLQQLTIQPYGLTKDNSTINIEVDGQVTNAEISDLNSDGFPELLIYTVSAGSGSYGNVIGYSVNNGKSISSIYFPSLAENPKANKGYMGHDRFAIIENTLVQRFQTYNEKDTNANPTGNIRQIEYKLRDGEASRKFVLNKIVEYK